jgi:single-strand DNA-binding protein
MNDINQTLIEGKIIRELELRYTPCGAAVCDIIIASNMYLTKTDQGDGSTRKQTTHLKITLWNEKAKKYSRILLKGDKILVTGKLIDDNYVIKETNTTTRGRLKMDNVETLRFLERGSEIHNTADGETSNDQ